MIKNASFWLLLALTLVSFSVTPVMAVTEEEVKDLFLNNYNPNVDEIIPDLPLVKSVFGEQVIHIIITDPDEDIELSAITDSNGYITELTSGAPEKPTLRLKSNSETVDRIKNSENPVFETKEAFKKGDITYEGVSISQKVKVAIIKVVEYFAKLFGVI